MSLLRDAGLSSLAETFDPTKDTMDRIANELIIGAFASGKLFFLLGATIEEIGVEWTIDTAKANGEFFSKLRKKEDKDALRGSIVGVLLSFLISGVLASVTSPKSSVDVALVPSETDASLVSSEDLPDMTSESGTTSSARLQGVT